MVGVLYAFTEYSPFTSPEFIGLENFKTLFSSAMFWRAFKNTLIISTMKMVLCMGSSLLLALLLGKR